MGVVRPSLTMPLSTPRIQVVQDDITRLEVDAIVNAANESLLGGGGVDGAIHRAAGPDLLAECRTLGGARTGEAKTTRGYGLPAKYVIHTPGPIWRGGQSREDELLRNSYWNSLLEAEKHGVTSIAFPAISTGVYRFPLERASRIAVETVDRFLEAEASSVQTVVFCCFSDTTHQTISGLVNHLNK